MTDPVNSSPLPPVPNQVSPLSDTGISAQNKYQVDIKQYKFSATWTQWFVQVRDKLNVINSIISAISGLVSGTGFITSDGNGGANTRSIAGTAGKISVANGDGLAGNPTVSLIATGVTPGTYGDATHVPQITVDADGRATAVTSVLITGGGGSGAMTLIGTATVTGSAATTLSLSGLNLSTAGRYVIYYAFDNATGSSSNVSLYYNADSTATNYYREIATFSSTSVTSARSNDAFVMTLDANETSTGEITIQNDLDGKPRALVRTSRGAPSSIILQLFTHAWNSATNVTTINFTATVANSLAVNSYIKVFSIN